MQMQILNVAALLQSRIVLLERVAVYRVNQDADQWHILLAWRYAGSLYTVSEHVIRPYTYQQVVSNLDKLLAGLVLVRPQG